MWKFSETVELVALFTILVCTILYFCSVSIKAQGVHLSERLKFKEVIIKGHKIEDASIIIIARLRDFQ